jgi:hypothetical protein
MRMTTEGIKAGKAAATAMTNNNAEQEPKPAASPDVDEEGFKVVEKSKKTTPVEEAKATSKPAFDASALSPFNHYSMFEEEAEREEEVEENSSPQASRRIKFDDATEPTNKSEARKREKKERKEKKLKKESKRRKVEEIVKKSKKGSSPEVTGYEELEPKTSEKKKSKKHSSGKGSNKESETNESKRSNSTYHQNTAKSGNEMNAMETDNGEVENTADMNEEPQDKNKQSPVAR